MNVHSVVSLRLYSAGQVLSSSIVDSGNKSMN